MDESPQGEALRNAATLVRASTYAIALVGAGISVESGIPPFRGTGGLWTKRGEPPLDGYQRFLRDPLAYWQERLTASPAEDEFVAALDRAQPNPAHHALAALERAGLLHHVITQNVDDLHRRAGQQHLTEIHGNRHWVRCVNCCWRMPSAEFLVGSVPPSCPECGGLVKSDTVMFGEPIPGPALERCYLETERCDCMLVVGTSAQVYPAADFPVIARQRGATLIEMNLEETPLSDLCDVVVRGRLAETLPALVRALDIESFFERTS